MSYKILVIDDEPQFVTAVSPYLEMENHQVLAAKTPDEGLEILKNQRLEAVLLDVTLPGAASGVDLISSIKSIDTDVPIIMVSGRAEPRVVVQSIKAGAQDYLQKPFDGDELLKRIDEVIRERAKTRVASPASIPDIECQSLVTALQDSGGNISRAAKKLGLSRDTIYRRLKKFNIPLKGEYKAGAN